MDPMGSRFPSIIEETCWKPRHQAIPSSNSLARPCRDRHCLGISSHLQQLGTAVTSEDGEHNICMCIYIYICIRCMCIYIHIYIYIYIYIYIRCIYIRNPAWGTTGIFLDSNTTPACISFSPELSKLASIHATRWNGTWKRGAAFTLLFLS